MWQSVVAGLIVLTAAVYAVWALIPATLRLRLAQRLAASVQRAGRPRLLIRATAAIERVALRSAGGCSDCSDKQAARGRPKRLDKP